MSKLRHTGQPAVLPENPSSTPVRTDRNASLRYRCSLSFGQSSTAMKLALAPKFGLSSARRGREEREVYRRGGGRDSREIRTLDPVADGHLHTGGKNGLTV